MDSKSSLGYLCGSRAGPLSFQSMMPVCDEQIKGGTDRGSGKLWMQGWHDFLILVSDREGLLTGDRAPHQGLSSPSRTLAALRRPPSLINIAEPPFLSLRARAQCACIWVCACARACLHACPHTWMCACFFLLISSSNIHMKGNIHTTTTATITTTAAAAAATKTHKKSKSIIYHTYRISLQSSISLSQSSTAIVWVSSSHLTTDWLHKLQLSPNRITLRGYFILVSKWLV